MSGSYLNRASLAVQWCRPMCVECEAFIILWPLRVKLAVHKETHECVAVKVVHVDGSNGLTHESLRKEVSMTLMDHLSHGFSSPLLFCL